MVVTAIAMSALGIAVGVWGVIEVLRTRRRQQARSGKPPRKWGG